MNRFSFSELQAHIYAPLNPPQAVIEQGGLQPGGLNFDAKVRRESTELEDLFIAHIGAMDAFARGLRNAAKIFEEGVMQNMLRVIIVTAINGVYFITIRNLRLTINHP